MSRYIFAEKADTTPFRECDTASILGRPGQHDELYPLTCEPKSTEPVDFSSGN